MHRKLPFDQVKTEELLGVYFYKIGLFCNVLGTDFLASLAQKGTISGYFDNDTLKSKTVMATFGKIWQLFIATSGHTEFSS